MGSTGDEWFVKASSSGHAEAVVTSGDAGVLATSIFIFLFFFFFFFVFFLPRLVPDGRPR